VITMETAFAVRQTAPIAERYRACHHEPPCPAADAHDHLAARVVAAHPEQGWSLLCNGIIAFEDGGMILPDRPAPRRAAGSLLDRVACCA
jgi:hypothetical protein